MRLKLHISPCPNDTFIFDALLNGRIDSEGIEFVPHFVDIEELNRLVLSGVAEICKVSYAVLPLIVDRYLVLDSGSALGLGNGPLVVSKELIDLDDNQLRIATPGEHTTANLLLDRVFPNLANRTPILFSQIAERVVSGEFDAGVLIHEGRFTYAEQGLKLVADLGVEWERKVGLALPLGGIVVSRELPQELQQRIGHLIRRSIEYAIQNPLASSSFVRKHAQELSPSVIASHIDLFVNDFSLSLGDKGRRAVLALTGLENESDIFVEP